MSTKYEVIIVGAGPVGLFLACELALAKVSVLVLERDAEIDSWKYEGLGLRGLNTLSFEAFYRRGLLEKAIRAGDDARKDMKLLGLKFSGHFAGILLDSTKVDSSQWKYHLPGPASLPGPGNLGKLEEVLSDHARSLGVKIQRGREVTRFSDDGDMVTVWAGDECFTTQWLVGCDGGRSAVRRAAGFEFVGTEAEFIVYLGVCEVDRPELIKHGFQKTEGGLYIAPGPDRIFLVDFDKSFDRSQPVTLEQYQKVARRVVGNDVVIKSLNKASTTTDRAKQVTQYRKGRVLLAGDSAHIHSPMGAQGLNTGISDAMNLGWKLAASVKGFASPTLLDSYHQERHPVAAAVLDWTRAQTTILRPNPEGQALYNVVREIAGTPGGASYFTDRIWGRSQRYDLGSTHPLVGRSAPDFEFSDGSRLGPKLELGCFLLVDFENEQRVADCVKQWEPVVRYCGSTANETLGLRAVLMRPDGIVAWAADETIELDALKAAVSVWVDISQLLKED